MPYPVIFPVRERFARCTPDAVRAIASVHGFLRHEVPPETILRNQRFRVVSEIWYRLAGRGYAIIRIDAQGHAYLEEGGKRNAIGGRSPGPHGGVPHYHKEWIAA